MGRVIQRAMDARVQREAIGGGHTMKTTPALLLVILGSISCLQAQQNAVLQWSATYDGPGHVGAGLYGSALDRHGNWVITGVYFPAQGVQKTITMRYSPSGQPTLFDSYDSTGNGTSVCLPVAGWQFRTGEEIGCDQIRTFGLPLASWDIRSFSER